MVLNYEERFKELEQAIAKLSSGVIEMGDRYYRPGQAAEYIEENAGTEKPSCGEYITIDDCHYECADYEFEIDVEGTTVCVSKDFETDSASFNLCFEDVEVLCVEDLVKLRKWVAWTCKERGL